MNDTMKQAVTTPDANEAYLIAQAHIRATPASLTLIDRISDADWQDDDLWSGDIACGSDLSDPDELDNIDKVEAA